MKKNLLTIALLATMCSVQAQLLHVDNTANVYVSEGTLVYSGGGVQTKGTGVVENHGNFMIQGTTTDVFRNLDASGTEITTGNAGGSFVNKLNQPTAYASVNTNSSSATPVYTYGQLYISGLPQTAITGVVNQEYRGVDHGDYQQMGMPFYGKTVASLNANSGAELGKTFSTTRGSKNEILYWDNTNVYFPNLPLGLNTTMGVDINPYAYYIMGGNGLDVSNNTRTMVGRPVSDANMTVSLANAGANVNFGTGGNGINPVNEKYYTYLQDGFSASAGVWTGNFGKNIYQFGNPFMTNLDLSNLGVNQVNSDGNFLSNIYGVRLEYQGVQYSTGGGGGASAYKFITFGGGALAGDVDYAMIRPYGTFVVKLNENTTQPNLNLANLRRFNYYSRNAATTPYSVSANKNGASGTLKQLGVIGLDANGKEVARTYYIVSPTTISGHSSTVKAQVITSSSSLGTFEEDPVNGGYDLNNVNYWMYINEANEVNFKGKNIKLVNYDPTIVSYKFEIRENAALVANGTHLLSAGEGFYYKKSTDANVTAAIQGATVTANGTTNGVEYDLYYGVPNSGTLATSETTKSVKTMVIYNPDKDGYFVRFDPSWKTAEINVFDMSGKLILSQKGVNAKGDFDLNLDKKVKVAYIVNAVSEKGERVTSKIVR